VSKRRMRLYQVPPPTGTGTQPATAVAGTESLKQEDGE
jgi:hypothetical protein